MWNILVMSKMSILFALYLFLSHSESTQKPAIGHCVSKYIRSSTRQGVKYGCYIYIAIVMERIHVKRIRQKALYNKMTTLTWLGFLLCLNLLASIACDCVARLTVVITCSLVHIVHQWRMLIRIHQVNWNSLYLSKCNIQSIIMSTTAIERNQIIIIHTQENTCLFPTWAQLLRWRRLNVYIHYMNIKESPLTNSYDSHVRVKFHLRLDECQFPLGPHRHMCICNGELTQPSGITPDRRGFLFVFWFTCVCAQFGYS